MNPAVLDESKVLADLARIEAILTTGFSAMNDHLSRLNGSVGRHDAAIAQLQQDAAFAKGQTSGRDHGVGRIDMRDRNVWMALAAVATLVGPVAAIGIALWK